MSIFREAAVKIRGAQHQREDLKHVAPVVKMYIAGEWVTGEGEGKPSLVVNPTTEKVLGVIYDASPQQIQTAFAAAREAQQYWHLEVLEQEKEAVFEKIAHHLDFIRGPFSHVIIKEGGKLWKWAEAEVQETIDTVRHYHGEVSRMYGRYQTCQTPGRDTIMRREPYGVIFGITPWNFPVAVPSWKIFAALAGGNSIVVKSAEQTPTSLSILCFVVHRAIKEVLGQVRAEKLAGILQVLHGKGETVGAFALAHGDYDKVMFTGGTETGSIVGEIAGRRRKPVSLELGGHAAAILLNDYDLDRAVAEAVNACCGDAGQRCVSLREMFVDAKIFPEFVKRYTNRIANLRIGDPGNYQNNIEMGPLVTSEQVERVEEGVQKTLEEGGRLLHGGMPFKKAYGRSVGPFHNVAPEVWYTGHYFQPTLITVAESDFEVYAERNEIFGPVLIVRPISGNTSEEILLSATKRVNASRYGLSNSVLTNRLDLAMKAMRWIATGLLYIGRGPTGAEVGKKFGGVKDSGHGREGCGLEEVTYEKQVYVDYSGKLQMAQASSDDAVKKTLSSTEGLISQLFQEE